MWTRVERRPAASGKYAFYAENGGVYSLNPALALPYHRHVQPLRLLSILHTLIRAREAVMQACAMLVKLSSFNGVVILTSFFKC
jgi:hypothetical protein